jgi:tight adherence protein B
MVVGLVVLAVVIAAVPIRPQHRRVEQSTPTTKSGLAEIVRRSTRRRSGRRRPTARAVAAWCDEIARRVRSGSSLREAVAAVPDDDVTARATSPFRLAIDRGLAISESVARVDPPGPHLGLALDVFATASRIGGPSSASIDRTAVLLRQRASDLDERSSQAAQARLSSHVMTAVPLLLLAFLAATDHDVRAVVTSPVGAICVAAGLALNVAGWWWMRAIVGPPS